MVASGIFIAVGSSIVGTLGKQLLRYAELQRQSGGAWAGKAQVLGVLGQMVLSPLLDIVALGFAPQTVLAPFNGLTLVWNTLLAPVVLGESLSRSRVGSCVVITAGMVLNGVASAAREEHEAAAPASPEPEGTEVYTIAQLEAVLYRDVVLLYMLCLAAWIAANLVRSPQPRPAFCTAAAFSRPVSPGRFLGRYPRRFSPPATAITPSRTTITRKKRPRSPLRNR